MLISGATRRILAVFYARNLEFLRDRSTLGWNLLLPVALVLGLSLIFSGPVRPLFKVAVVAERADINPEVHPFFGTAFIQFISVDSRDPAMKKIGGHKLDMLVEPESGGLRYWISPKSPKGYMLERLLIASRHLEENNPDKGVRVEGEGASYLDWLLPGILGMNMMFSCLFGVGYVIVRYRKSEYLKRLSATPLTALEFVTAQILSRWILIMVITVFIYVGTQALVGFRMTGSHWLLFALAGLGSMSMISLSLVITARLTSEELAGGLLNMVTWPMMFLSSVWFSIEGGPPIFTWAAQALPLTHLLDGARAVMLEGAGMETVWPNVAALGGMTLLFTLSGAALFRWARSD